MRSPRLAPLGVDPGRFVVDFFAAAFLTLVLFAVVFLAVVFFAVVFLTAAFLAVVFLAAVLFAGTMHLPDRKQALRPH